MSHSNETYVMFWLSQWSSSPYPYLKKKKKESGHLARPREKQLNSLKGQDTSPMKTD